MEERGRKPIEHCDDETQRLWEWYATKLLVNVSRKAWDWSTPKIRELKLLVDRGCVTCNDEALLLQIIEMRGASFLKLRAQKKANPNQKVKQNRGRKKKNDPDSGGGGLVGRYELFQEKLEWVKEVRTKDGGGQDKFGWYKRIQSIEAAKAAGNVSTGGGFGTSDFEMMEIEVEEV